MGPERESHLLILKIRIVVVLRIRLHGLQVLSFNVAVLHNERSLALMKVWT